MTKAAMPLAFVAPPVWLEANAVVFGSSCSESALEASAVCIPHAAAPIRRARPYLAIEAVTARKQERPTARVRLSSSPFALELGTACVGKTPAAVRSARSPAPIERTALVWHAVGMRRLIRAQCALCKGPPQ